MMVMQNQAEGEMEGEYDYEDVDDPGDMRF